MLAAPIAFARVEPIPGEAVWISPMGATGAFVMVVEDNEDDVYFLRRALRSLPGSVELKFLGDGRSALDYLTARGNYADRTLHPLPSMVFLDLKLPFMNGLEVLAEIRARDELKDLPVYVLTSSSEERDREQAEALGVDGYLVKPPTREVVEPIVVRRLVLAT
jgi:CheY-like chemotaxis protein